MGMTPLEGLMMGTRSGSVDPGCCWSCSDDGRQSLDELRDALQRESGLLGVSGVSADLREVERAAAAGDRRAALAIDIFVRRAAAGHRSGGDGPAGLDALVFTAGIGEHAADVRAAICARLASWACRASCSPRTDGDEVLSLPGSRVAVLRVEAREDLVIGREVARLLGEVRPSRARRAARVHFRHGARSARCGTATRSASQSADDSVQGRFPPRRRRSPRSAPRHRPHPGPARAEDSCRRS